MGKKEEITDVLIDRAYTDKDADGKYVFVKGKVLKFNYEGSPIFIKVTRIDRVNKRMWGEHISLYDFNTGMSHYDHKINTDNPERVYCNDCEVEISQPATEEGETKAMERIREENKKEEVEEEIRDKKRRFQYELLKTDGTIQDFGVSKRWKVGKICKVLKCTTIERIPGAYYTGKWLGKSVGFGDIEGPLYGSLNPHFLELVGDPGVGDPEKMVVLGDVLMQTEVTS